MIKNIVRPALASALACVALLGCAPHDQQAEPLQGVVELEEQVLAFEVGGRVDAVNVARGDVITPDMPLVALDDTLERAARDANANQLEAARARANLLRSGSRPEEIRAVAAQLRGARANEELLQKNLEREKTLLDHGAVPEARVDELNARLLFATAEREALEQKLRALRNGARPDEIRAADFSAGSAESSVELHDARLERHVLAAPEPGEIIDVHVEVGEVVAPGAPIVTLADTRRPYADVFVPQERLPDIQRGAHATVTVDGDARPFSGVVEHIGRRTEFTPRFLFSERERPNLVVRVRIRIDDPEQRLHAGVPAFVTIDPSGDPS